MKTMGFLSNDQHLQRHLVVPLSVLQTLGRYYSCCCCGNHGLQSPDGPF